MDSSFESPISNFRFLTEFQLSIKVLFSQSSIIIGRMYEERQTALVFPKSPATVSITANIDAKRSLSVEPGSFSDLANLAG